MLTRQGAVGPSRRGESPPRFQNTAAHRWFRRRVSTFDVSLRAFALLLFRSALSSDVQSSARQISSSSSVAGTARSFLLPICPFDGHYHSVATGGHMQGTHPAPAVLGHGIRADPKFFWGEGRRRADSATNLRRKAFDCCKLSVYISGSPDPHRPTGGPPLDPAGGLPSPDPLCPP